MSGIGKLKSGDFNYMRQERQPDGTVIVTLSKRGESIAYKLHVRDLYGKNEEVLQEEILDLKKSFGSIVEGKPR